jgi:hypothetical protein
LHAAPGEQICPSQQASPILPHIPGGPGGGGVGTVGFESDFMEVAAHVLLVLSCRRSGAAAQNLTLNLLKESGKLAQFEFESSGYNNKPNQTQQEQQTREETPSPGQHIRKHLRRENTDPSLQPGKLHEGTCAYV